MLPESTEKLLNPSTLGADTKVPNTTADPKQAQTTSLTSVTTTRRARAGRAVGEKTTVLTGSAPPR
jgi:hypothetical protein